MASELRVRPYRPSDRDAVRRICVATGYMGEPATWYWRDEQSFADVWTGYYTDHEPESLFVAVDADDRVAGYVTGCIDTAKAPTAEEAITRQILRRALFLRPGTAGFMWRSVFDTVRDRGIPQVELDDPRWPSHLHINLMPQARGHGMGTALVRRLFAHLDQAGSPGCHLVTMAENLGGIGFFESVGFTRHGPPVKVPGMRTRAGARMHSQPMTCALPAG